MVNIKDREEMDWLLKAWKDAEDMWQKTRPYDVRRIIKRAFKYIDKKYDKIPEEGIEKVIEEFNVNNAKALSDRTIIFGHAYAVDAMSEFLKNPEIFWKLYEESKNKEKFLEEQQIEYGISKQKNLYTFVQGCFSSFFYNNGKKMSVDEIDKLSDKQKGLIIEHVTESVSKAYKLDCQKNEKEVLIAGLQRLIKELDEFGTLEENETQYNEFMKKNGLDSLMIYQEKDKRVPLTERLSTKYLEQFSYFQLEALYSFYTNRVEKIEEEIGLGLFIISTSVKAKDYNGKGYDIDDKNLKTIWQEHYIFHRFFEEKRKELNEICTPNTDMEGMENLKGYETEEVYEKLFKKYEKLFNHLLGNGRDVKKDFITFGETSGLAQLNNYTMKNLVLEDIIILATKEKINWGYIADIDSYGTQKYALIGMDIPGLSMPIRLHIPRKRLQALMKEYLKTDEIPVYIGSEDFRKEGNNVGTPLILPITSKEKDAIKRGASNKKKEQNQVSLVQHIAYTQLPNPVQRLLKWKYNGKKKYQDYINIDSGKIRYTDETPVQQTDEH
ncbi:MAG: hypothetical protein J6C46_11080 [Clostridia bacterium]|nr:hypothetical protein [Clostridia bacterium]